MFKLEIAHGVEDLTSEGDAVFESYQDVGIVDTLTSPTMADLIKQLKSKFSQTFLNSLEVYEDRLEGAYTDKDILGKERLVSVTMYISEVNPSPLSNKELTYVLGKVQS